MAVVSEVAVVTGESRLRAKCTFLLLSGSSSTSSLEAPVSSLISGSTGSYT